MYLHIYEIIFSRLNFQYIQIIFSTNFLDSLFQRETFVIQSTVSVMCNQEKSTNIFKENRSVEVLDSRGMDALSFLILHRNPPPRALSREADVQQRDRASRRQSLFTWAGLYPGIV